MEKSLQWRRRIVVGLVAVALAAGIGYGFYPDPLQFDIAPVSRGPLRVTIEQEGRTRVVDRYVVAAPVAGHARRIRFDVGSPVAAGATLVELEPLRPQALDARTRAEATARVRAAASNAAAARQGRDAARADAALAQQELARVRALRASGYSTVADLDRAAGSAARSAAMLRTAEFSAATAVHELEAARTALMYAAAPGTGGLVTVRSPVAGRVLSIPRKSEGPVAAGQALIEIGDPGALEVEVDLLSADAVRVQPGTRVLFERWGGAEPLQGEVKRVEPAGFTKISALGVEEQRVWTIVGFTSPRPRWERLGDGYRVEASFIVWEGRDILQVPASALFRDGAQWAAYVVNSGRARKRHLRPGVSNGLQTQVLSGLTAGERVIAHPDDRLQDGARVDGGD
ncbi:MAG TPA: HlyD family efflux transporter periplasmic adaptor subunit [Telluria sp.]|nr:HlyD family efflux transporter periplasmic adaptor subunit [Telluria sp.]